MFGIVIGKTLQEECLILFRCDAEIHCPSRLHLQVMLRFSVVDEQGSARAWPLINAHLLGADDTASVGVIAFKNGKIVCKPIEQNAHALSLEVDAGKAGTMMLQTCLLKQRDEPYRFYEELARHRIKVYLDKSENWGLLDPAKAPDAFELFEHARSLFVAGMVERDPFRAEMYHRDALAHGIFASEKLVMRRSEWTLHARYATKGASRALGVRAPIEKDPQMLQAVLSKEFDILSVPTPWHIIEPSQGRFVWDQVDRWVQFGKQSGRQLILGPLFDATASGVPGWVRPSVSDPAKLKDLLYSFIKEVVTRYGPTNPFWNIATSVHQNEVAQFSSEAMVQITRAAAVSVRQVRKDSKLLVEVADPFSDTAPNERHSIGAIQYLRALISEGVPIDLVGLPIVVGDSTCGRSTRDLMQITAMLERFTSRKEMPPIIITACGAPSAPHSNPGAGSWREPWSLRSQSAWASMIFQISMANSGIAGVVWDRLRDDAGVGLRDGGLIASDGTAKPAAERLWNTRRRLRSPLGPLQSAIKDSAPEAQGGS